MGGVISSEYTIFKLIIIIVHAVLLLLFTLSHQHGNIFMHAEARNVFTHQTKEVSCSSWLLWCVCWFGGGGGGGGRGMGEIAESQLVTSSGSKVVHGMKGAEVSCKFIASVQPLFHTENNRKTSWSLRKKLDRILYSFIVAGERGCRCMQRV